MSRSAPPVLPARPPPRSGSGRNAPGQIHMANVALARVGPESLVGRIQNHVAREDHVMDAGPGQPGRASLRTSSLPVSSPAARADPLASRVASADSPYPVMHFRTRTARLPAAESLRRGQAFVLGCGALWRRAPCCRRGRKRLPGRQGLHARASRRVQGRHACPRLRAR